MNIQSLAEGVPSGVERGVRDGERAAGPVGAIVGGTVGGEVGGVAGIFGADQRPCFRSYVTGADRSRSGEDRDAIASPLHRCVSAPNFDPYRRSTRTPVIG
jgi:uncharacterized protein YcfJ